MPTSTDYYTGPIAQRWCAIMSVTEPRLRYSEVSFEFRHCGGWGVWG